MEGLEQERRGIFGGVKAPFDLNAVFLAFIAIVLFFVGVKGIEWGIGEPNILPRIVRSVNLPYIEGLNRQVYSDATWAEVTQRWADMNKARVEEGKGVKGIFELSPAAYIVTGAWALILWAFFGAAIGRIMAMKIARDEGLEIREALKFGWQKCVSNFLSVVTIGIVILFLYILCNTFVAGYATSIPYIGNLLLIPIFPALLLSCLIILLLTVPLVLGFTMMSSAIAAESSDSFDGMSRAFSYVYSRPWQVILIHLLTFAYLGLFCWVSMLFVDMSTGSLRTLGWGMNESKAEIIRGYVVGENSFTSVPISKAFYDKATEHGIVAEDAKLVEEFATEADKAKDGVVEEDAELKAVLIARAVAGVRVNAESQISSTLRFSGSVLWFGVLMVKLFALAYMVAYWFSANQAMYFILRRDVDGEDPSEIYIEEERDEEPYEITIPEGAGKEGGPTAAASASDVEIVEPKSTGAPKPKPSQKRKTSKAKSSRRSATGRSSRKSGPKKSGRGKSGE
ncbi:MAG: hypothetical protein O7H41_09590 [Planctomycetota bacterium]|nr:hypothetical protein [Planctomycetota bacterium]